jgi:hypothetical protein
MPPGKSKPSQTIFTGAVRGALPSQAQAQALPSLFFDTFESCTESSCNRDLTVLLSAISDDENSNPEDDERTLAKRDKAKVNYTAGVDDKDDDLIIESDVKSATNGATVDEEDDDEDDDLDEDECDYISHILFAPADRNPDTLSRRSWTINWIVM